jgi:hypothetical protein
MAEKKQIGPSLTDRKIMTLFANGASPEEVEAATYVPAATALQRARDILASTDIWDEIEQRRLLLHSLKGIKGRVEDEMDFSDAKVIAAYSNMAKVINEIQTTARAITDDEMDKLARAQASQMIRLIEMSFTHARKLLAEEYPEVDLGRIDTVFYDALRENAGEIEMG